MSEEHLGQRYARPAKQVGGVSFGVRWAIVRQVCRPDHPEDGANLFITVEYARRGRNFSDAGSPEDYGRWVGEHEHARGGENPPPEADYPDYLHEVSLLPHTVANDFTYFLFPHAYDPEHPATYRDTHVDDTDLVMLVGPPSDLIAVPVYRDWDESVDSAARHHDCIVEGAGA